MVQQPPAWCEVCGGGDHDVEGGNQNQHQGQASTGHKVVDNSTISKAMETSKVMVNVVSTRSGHPLEELTPKAKAAEEKGKQVDKAEPSEQRVNEKPKAKPPPPFPQKFKKQKEEECFGKFIELLKQVHVNLPLIDVFQGIPKYAKYVKGVVANKSRLAEYATVTLTEECSSRIQNSLPTKLKDPGSFTVHIKIGKCIEAIGLCDLGASINLMPTSIFLKLGLGRPKSKTIMLQLPDRSVARPDGVIEDILVQVGTVIFPIDFVILDFEPEIPFILGRPFLAIGGVLIDVAAGRLTMRAHDKVEVFDVYKAMKLPAIYEELSAITVIDEEMATKYVEALDPLDKVLIGQDIEGYVEAQELANVLDVPNVEASLKILRKRKKAIGWQMADIHGINPAFCMHMIFMEEGHKSSVQPQHRLNPMMKDMVCKELSGYNQIVIPPEDQEKTTFTSPYGTYAFKGMSFGLCNALATFQRCMIAIFHDMVADFVEIFMDDFSVFGESFDMCLENLDRQYIQAFESLKKMLIEAPILTSPNWELPFELMCDASDVAVGAVLGQMKEKVFHSIYYASKTLDAAQTNYTVIKKEILALVYAFDKFRSYLVGTKVVVYTDHAAIRYLFNKKDAKPRLIRWILLLQEFDIEIKDRRGSENQITYQDWRVRHMWESKVRSGKSFLMNNYWR
ncbi:uncharacterized protein LOC125825111 [Solanum verrucosum]|uniref:uncharacterized protein LOC125825111 n=1 Tax=Solanum verrucosum TaxID=315347 RepID=UPI0020D1DCE1|nr:uncharacterized protein LOC125825111 [Solanum verrucosum]